jgi:hypothetical protein
MKRKWVYFLFTIPILVHLNCKIFDSSDEEIKPIEGFIEFSVLEKHKEYDTVCEPNIMLSMATEKIYPCCNWSIISDVTLQNNQIFVTISGIYIPEICLTALGPATSRDFLDIPNGEYSLYLSYRNTVDRYTLSVTDSYIETYNITTQFTTPKFKLFWRYPINSFAYICGTTTETSWAYEDFLDTLLSKIPLEEFLFPKSGRIPYPESGDGHNYDPPAKYFLYESEEDFDKAGEILEAYTKNVISSNPGISISLIGWNNKNFYSWLLDD